MDIAGLQRLTLLDFPGRAACTVFLAGCDLRCPFCHNSGLLDGGEPLMDDGELLDFLQKRRGLLDGVCVSGGEPTLQPGLPALLARVRALGFQIKLDTNGARPGVLRSLAAEGLVDYVAMDVKNSPARYPETAGLPALDLAPILESLSFLLNGGLDYELRTTVVDGLHDEGSFLEIGAMLRSLAPERRARRYFLQPFISRPSVPAPGLRPPSPEALAAYAAILAPFAEEVSVRGQ